MVVAMSNTAEEGQRRLPRRYLLYQPGGITPANLAALQHRGIDADPTLIVLDRRPQDARILREVTLGERCHHAAQAGASDAQANGVPDGEHLELLTHDAKKKEAVTQCQNAKSP